MVPQPAFLCQLQLSGANAQKGATSQAGFQSRSNSLTEKYTISQPENIKCWTITLPRKHKKKMKEQIFKKQRALKETHVSSI